MLSICYLPSKGCKQVAGNLLIKFDLVSAMLLCCFACTLNVFVYKMAGAISASCPEPSLVKSEGRGRKIWKTGQIEST